MERAGIDVHHAHPAQRNVPLQMVKLRVAREQNQTRALAGVAVHRGPSLADDLEHPDGHVLVLEDEVLVPPGLLDDHVFVRCAVHAFFFIDREPHAHAIPYGGMRPSDVLLVDALSRDCVNHGQLLKAPMTAFMKTPLFL